MRSKKPKQSKEQPVKTDWRDSKILEKDGAFQDNADYKDIFDWLISQKIVEKITSKYANFLGDYPRDDFEQEMWVNIICIPIDKLIQLYRDNEIIPYIQGIIYHQISDRNSPFYKLYKSCGELDIDEQYNL